ncbi:MAG: helix-turn-helix transcriptional regulator [Saprospiraceae bacterium]|nr:helix-turn-helix transcriptional regulator [Saprospiraceae bacterium]
MEKKDRFLQKVIVVVNRNMEREGFGTTELCQALFLSRSQLHRKLRTLTGKSTTKVIRGIKMAKAMELLLHSNKNIAEVGYAVGYGNSSHFTQVFKEEFGKPPSHFRP